MSGLDDVGTRLCGVLRQLETVLGRHRGGARLHDDVGVGCPTFFDRDFQQAFSLVDGKDQNSAMPLVQQSIGCLSSPTQ